MGDYLTALADPPLVGAPYADLDHRDLTWWLAHRPDLHTPRPRRNRAPHAPDLPHPLHRGHRH
ncbi:hypothetical protein [Streptomyces fumanus]|uniref:hypothetical protein n=1 Tax=Streptomyces fumanus TaxID=67302 RepID=UPI00167D126C|nr:hypothetical protein [Streptomyces fumanus]